MFYHLTVRTEFDIALISFLIYFQTTYSTQRRIHFQFSTQSSGRVLPEFHFASRGYLSDPSKYALPLEIIIPSGW